MEDHSRPARSANEDAGALGFLAGEAAPEIDARSVSFTYPDDRHRALDDLTFTIPRASTFVVLGPNGSGKTTLFNLLVGLHTPSAGSLSAEGGPIEEFLEAQRLEWIPDDFVHAPMFTLDGYLQYLSVARPVFERRLADDLLAPFALTEKLHVPIGAMSQGERKKALLVGAIACRPAVVVMDEPFIGLDPESQLLMEATLGELRHSGTSIVIMSNWLEAVRHIATHLAVLQNGKLRAVGTRDELFSREGARSLRELYFAVTGGTESAAARTHDVRYALHRASA